MQIISFEKYFWELFFRAFLLKSIEQRIISPFHLLTLSKSNLFNNFCHRCSCGLTLPIADYSAHSGECWVIQEENEKAKSNLLDKTKMKFKKN